MMSIQQLYSMKKAEDTIISDSRFARPACILSIEKNMIKAIFDSLVNCELKYLGNKWNYGQLIYITYRSLFCDLLKIGESQSFFQTLDNVYSSINFQG